MPTSDIKKGPLYVDSTNNRIGVGTASVNTYGGKLNIVDGSVGGETTLVVANNNANQFIRMGINADVAQIAYDNADSLAFGIATDSTISGLTTEHMRIDSSGNLLVGHTGSIYNNINTTSTIGSSYSTNGEIFACSDESSGVMFLNRKSSDGAIATFRKDGTTVGSIGTLATNNVYVTNPTSGLIFSSNLVAPCDPDGTSRNNLVDLGNSSRRFKDLWLSGGVYLGGTGSANLLDDYEEGTWTPNFAGLGTATNNNATAYYAKIGKVVYLTFPYTTWTLGAGSGTTDIEINNLPFTNQGTTNSDVIGLQANGVASAGLQTNLLFLSSSTRVKFYRNSSTSWIRLTGSYIQSNWSFGASVFYFTND